MSSGDLPAGLSLEGSTGRITGIPTGTPGTSDFTVTVTDDEGTPATASQDLSITVAAAPVTTVASTTKLSVSPASAAIGAARTVTATVTKSGGIPTGSVTFKSGGTTKTVALTIRMNSDFLSSARPGDWLEGTARVTRATRSVVFCEAELYVGQRTVLRATGVFKLMQRHRELSGGEPVAS